MDRPTNVTRVVRLALLLLLLAPSALPGPAAAREDSLALMADQPAPSITVPAGFTATLVARLPEFKQPTSIAYGPDGALYIAVLAGEIYRLTDEGELTQYAGLFPFPLGLAWRGNDLYLASVSES